MAGERFVVRIVWRLPACAASARRFQVKVSKAEGIGATRIRIRVMSRGSRPSRLRVVLTQIVQRTCWHCLVDVVVIVLLCLLAMLA